MKPIVFVGESWGEQEDKIKQPFVGPAGVELLRMSNEAGLISLTPEDYDYINRFYEKNDPNLIDMVWRLHPEITRTNVFNLRPPGNKIEAFCGPKKTALPGYPALIKGKFVQETWIKERVAGGVVIEEEIPMAPQLERLGDELLSLDPNLIIALGNTPMWALTGKTTITKLRGATCLSSLTISGFKVLPTFHPSAVLRQWELRPTTMMDLSKAIKERDYPDIRRPKREVWIEPTLEDLYEFHRRFIKPAKRLAVDIETTGNRITCIGFAPDSTLALVIPFDDPRRRGKSYWADEELERRAWRFVAETLQEHTPPKTFQNGTYDIAFLLRAYGIKVYGAEEDSMLLHHALQPESLKGLGFLGSIYTDEGAWKVERKKTETIKRDE